MPGWGWRWRAVRRRRARLRLAVAQAPSAPAGAQATGAATPQVAAGHRPTKKDRDEAQKLFVEGAKDIDHNNVRAAMDDFMRAAELNPEEKKYEMADQIAREHLVTELIQRVGQGQNPGPFCGRAGEDCRGVQRRIQAARWWRSTWTSWRRTRWRVSRRRVRRRSRGLRRLSSSRRPGCTAFIFARACAMCSRRCCRRTGFNQRWTTPWARRRSATTWTTRIS